MTSPILSWRLMRMCLLVTGISISGSNSFRENGRVCLLCGALAQIADIPLQTFQRSSLAVHETRMHAHFLGVLWFRIKRYVCPWRQREVFSEQVAGIVAAP